MKVLITGGSRGLGRSLLEHYRSHGLQVVTVSRQPVELTGVTSLIYDLSDKTQWDPFLNQAMAQGPFDLVINNLGINRRGLLSETDSNDIADTINVNFTLPVQLTQTFLKNHVVNNGGTFVFINTLGHFSSYPSSAAYVASKSGLHSFVRSMKAAYGRDYQFTSIYPGPLDTDQARENSPLQQNHNRLSPQRAAEKIAKAVAHGKVSYVPGTSMKLLTVVSRMTPGFMEKMMKKTLLRPLIKGFDARRRESLPAVDLFDQ